MKDFFRRHQARLDAADIQRFARILVEDLRPVLEGYDLVVRLLDAPQAESEVTPEVSRAVAANGVLTEAESGRLHVPVVFQGEPLAVVAATPSSGRRLAEAVQAVLPALVRLSLEKILMYKINVTDQETGLNNEDFLRAYLRQALKPARPGKGAASPRPLQLGAEKDGHPAMLLVLAEVVDFARLASDHGRLESSRAMKALAEWLKAAGPSPSCVARLERGRLALALPHVDPQAGQELVDRLLLEGPPRLNDLPPLRLAFGLAHYPHDFSDEGGSESSNENGNGSTTELLLAKADLALRHALLDKARKRFSYHDVLSHGGRVVQVLPFNRLVINIGRAAGAREGQVFVLADPGSCDAADYKGEVVLFEVRDDFSVGEIIQLRQSTRRVQNGDAVMLSRATADAAPLGETGGEQSLDGLLGIPDHRGFAKLLADLLEGQERFAVVLARVDGFDRYRSTMGHLESDRQFRGLLDLIREGLPRGAVVGRFATDSLAVFLPGLDEGAARGQAEAWRKRIVDRHPQTASFGVACFPLGPFSRSEIVTNAQKALDHAAFFGPASMAVFDSTSLNISGDKLFESGDLDGAIQEYCRALEINPGDLNVLNSLGVCYGYRQQHDEAMETFGRALALDPDNLMAHFNKGFVLAAAGRREEALASLRRAVEIDASNFEALLQLGKLSLDMDLLDEALGCFERASSLEDRRPEVFRYLGQALLRKGRKDEAVDAFKAAARHDPEDAPSLSQLGVLFIDRGTDIDVALSLIRQSVELDGTNSVFRQRLGRALAVAGELERSVEEYRRAIEMGARSREVQLELGQALARLDRRDEARAAFQAAVEIDPEYRPALDALKSLEGQPALA